MTPTARMAIICGNFRVIRGRNSKSSLYARSIDSCSFTFGRSWLRVASSSKSGPGQRLDPFHGILT